IGGDELGVAQVGRHDSFFELGGHSLLVMRVVARIQVDLGLEVPLVALFESPTLADFAEAVDRAGARAQSQARAQQHNGDYN
ncbi:phosphopantetheine-binding protein, partial [Enterococcus faecalis]|uniref:phosphopantetheine-binding protein n=1 Tax=Enterococcus faecalis TaxID=1351 RepID=UPI0039866CC0